MEWARIVWRNPVRALRLLRMATDELADYAKGRLVELIERYDPNREHWRLVCSYTAGLCDQLAELAERAKKIYWRCSDEYGLDYYCAKNTGWEEIERELKRIAAEALDDIVMLLDEVADALDALCPDLDHEQRG